MGKRNLITIGRQYGSGGREIGQKLADRLGIAFYDKELLVLAAKNSGIHEDLFQAHDEKPINSLLYSLSVNPYAAGGIAGVPQLPLNNRVFLAVFQTIQKLAKEQDCVIVGRCADYALRSEPDCLNVFIHAPLPYRIGRIQQSDGLNVADAKERILKTDKKRAAYYNSYADRKWGDLQSYHLAFDSSRVGIDGAVDLIIQFANSRL